MNMYEKAYIARLQCVYKGP